jgi:hypothetical protein
MLIVNFQSSKLEDKQKRLLRGKMVAMVGSNRKDSAWRLPDNEALMEVQSRKG